MLPINLCPVVYVQQTFDQVVWIWPVLECGGLPGCFQVPGHLVQLARDLLGSDLFGRFTVVSAHLSSATACLPEVCGCLSGTLTEL